MQSLQPVATGTYELRRAPPPMRALVVASDKEEGGGGLLADAAAGSAPSSGSQSAEAERNAALRILFDHWLKQRRSLARIGSYDSLSEVFQHSRNLTTVGEKPNVLFNTIRLKNMVDFFAIPIDMFFLF